MTDITTVLTDVNGLSQTTYVAADDFVLSGRPDTRVFMPFQGTVHFSATVDKQKVTSDDVKVVLLHNGLPVSVANPVFTAAFGVPDCHRRFRRGCPRATHRSERTWFAR